MIDEEILEMVKQLQNIEIYSDGFVETSRIELIKFAKLIAKRQRQIDAEIARRFEPDEHLDFADYASTAILAQGD